MPSPASFSAAATSSSPGSLTSARAFSAAASAVVVTPAPTAGFLLSAPSGTAPLLETISDQSLNAASYDYDWGDETAHATTAAPSHTYTVEGNYTVTQTVVNAGGTATASHAVTVTAIPVTPPSPLAIVLPPASQYAAGTSLEFADPGNVTSASHPLTLTPSAVTDQQTGLRDTLNGATSTVIALTGVGSVRVYSDGVHGWQLSSQSSSDPAGAASAAQAFAIQRANQTGTQLLSTISDAGTAAARNVGGNANDVVALGSDGKLPAYNGSKLFNLSSGGLFLPENYGPVGTADDTATVQAAVNAAALVSGTVVLARVYNVTSITLGVGNTTGFSFVSMRGQSQQQSGLRKIAPTDGSAPTGDLLYFNGNKYSTFRDFSLFNASANRGTTVGVRMGGASFGNASSGNMFSGVSFSGFDIGWKASTNPNPDYPNSGTCASETTLKDCSVFNCNKGLCNDDFNALNNRCFNVDVQGCAYGFFDTTSGGLSMYGTSGEFNGFDFFFKNPTNGISPAVVTGHRSENVGVLMFSRGPVSLNGILMVGFYNPPAGQPDLITPSLASMDLPAGIARPAIVLNNSRSHIVNSVIGGPVYETGKADVFMGTSTVAASDPILFVNTANGARYETSGCSTIAPNLDSGTLVPYPDRQGTWVGGAPLDALHTDTASGATTLNATILASLNAGSLPLSANGGNPGDIYLDGPTNTLKVIPRPVQTLLQSLAAYPASMTFVADAGTLLTNGAAVYANGAPVTKWQDQASNNYAGNAYAAAPTTLVLAALNGHACLHFAGQNSSGFILNSGVTLSGSESVVAVMRCTADSMLLGGQSVNNQLRVNQPTQTLSASFGGQASNSTTAANLAVWSVLEFLYSGGQLSYFQNGNALGSGPMTNLPTFELLAEAQNGVVPFAGDIAALVKVPAANSAAAAALLKAYYGL